MSNEKINKTFFVAQYFYKANGAIIGSKAKDFFLWMTLKEMVTLLTNVVVQFADCNFFAVYNVFILTETKTYS